METNDISLKALIHTVSEELLASQAERQSSGLPPVFQVQDLSIEVSFVVTKSKEGGGGFSLSVVKADAKAKYDTESVHKITLKLRALSEADLALPDLPGQLPPRPRSRDE